MTTDIAIAGGGLAGLASAIIAGRMGFEVTLLEKKAYPFHKVCGEYLSVESESLLNWLGFPIEEFHLPRLSKFLISHPSGRYFEAPLPKGGIGVSRFTLDSFLKEILEKEGGIVLENSRVEGLEVRDGDSILQYRKPGENTSFLESRVVLGSFGRNKPRFAGPDALKEKPRGFVGVKMHVRGDLSTDRIELHHFPGGYCGISAVEGGLYCLCYLISEECIREVKGNLEEAELRFLHKNPFLRKYLTQFSIHGKRISTSGIHFEARPLVQDGILMLGDSAGMIPPLAGNGMSMALHASVLAMESVQNFLKGHGTRTDMETAYAKNWRKTFGSRLKMARFLQKLMERPGMTKTTVSVFRAAPFLFPIAVSRTHGTEIPIPKIL